MNRMKHKLLFSLTLCVILLLPQLVKAQVVVLVQQPAAVENSYDFTQATTWGADLNTVSITSTVAIVDDGTVGDSLGCNPLINGAAVTGKIAIIYRGNCNFSVKALNAQNAGAVAAVIINNIPGSPVGMAAGTGAPEVTIPVVMISMEDGALLRPYMDDGSLEMFIGNNEGLFSNNIGFYPIDASSALSFATPHVMALDSMDFKVLIGAWVHNYGSQTQTSVVLNATVNRDGTPVYDELNSGITILSGDSAYITLPTHGSLNYQMGYYTLTYSVASSNQDEFTYDNELTYNWWINENRYSKSRIDPVTNEPLGNSGTRSTVYQNGWQWCTMMRSDNASAANATGITAATLTNGGVPLTGMSFQVTLYDWNDPLLYELNDLTQVGTGYHTYTSDLQGEFITVDFTEPVDLVDSQKYLSCISTSDDLYIVTDEEMDYSGNVNAYPEDIISLVYVDFTWNANGFGPSTVPAIITELCTQSAVSAQVSETACGSYFWNNQTYTQSGNYDYLGYTAEGCDSTVTLELTINEIYWTSENHTLCEGESVTVGTTTYDSGGNYTQQLTSDNNCDSTVYVNITLYNEPSVTILGNATIAMNSTETYAIVEQPGYSIVWSVLNGTVLSGQGTTSADIFWDGSGEGTLTATLSNGNCTYSFTLEVGITVGLDSHDRSDINVHPNPSNGIFNLSGVDISEYQVHDAVGRLIESKKTNPTIIDLSAQPSGIYTLQVMTENGWGTQKLIKQ